MKKIVSGICAVVLALGLAACGGGSAEAAAFDMETFLESYNAAAAQTGARTLSESDLEALVTQEIEGSGGWESYYVHGLMGDLTMIDSDRIWMVGRVDGGQLDELLAEYSAFMMIADPALTAEEAFDLSLELTSEVVLGGAEEYAVTSGGYRFEVSYEATLLNFKATRE